MSMMNFSFSDLLFDMLILGFHKTVSCRFIGPPVRRSAAKPQKPKLIHFLPQPAVCHANGTTKWLPAILSGNSIMMEYARQA